MFAAATAFLLPVAFSPASTSPAWLPKTALLLAVVPVAVAALLLSARLDAAILAATAFLAATVASASQSSSPILSLVGPYAAGTSVLLFGGLVGLYGVGRRVADGASRSLVASALLGAVGVNAALALLQARVDLGAYGLEIVESRSAALLGNPVHLATLLAGGLPLAWDRVRGRRGRTPVLVLVAMSAGGAQVSGSRFLLLGLAVGVLYVLVRHRNVSAALFAGAVVVGALGGAAAGSRPEFAGASDRITGVGLAEGSTMQRLYTWQEAVPTVLDRPLLGFGPGRYLPATVAHRSVRLAKAGPDSYFADAHNLLVDTAVSTGLVGLFVLLLWLVLAVARARGPLLWAALAILGMHLVEPVHPGTTPLVGLLLGAAATASAPAPLRRWSVGPVAVAALAGVAIGGWVLIGDLRLQEARLDADRRGAAAAARMLPPWPETSDAVARLVIFDAVIEKDPRLWTEAVSWELRAVEEDRSDPRWWVLAGLVEAKAGQTASAEQSFRTALTLNPYSCGAWNGLRRLQVTLPTADRRYGSLCEPEE